MIEGHEPTVSYEKDFLSVGEYGGNGGVTIFSECTSTVIRFRLFVTRSPNRMRGILPSRVRSGPSCCMDGCAGSFIHLRVTLGLLRKVPGAPGRSKLQSSAAPVVAAEFYAHLNHSMSAASW
jgi:hypothetical protein